jgi:lipopolysaccharide export system permease protein
MTILTSTLSRYFFSRYMTTFLVYCLGLLLVILLVDFNETSRRLSRAPDYTVALGLLVSALRVPSVLQLIIPFVVLIASIATLMQLNRKYELVVTRAAGISAWQFLAPLIIANLLIGVLSITVLNTLAASRDAKSGGHCRRKQSGQPATDQHAAPWLRQRTAEGDTVLGRPGQLRRRHQTLGRNLFPVRPGPADQGAAGGRERASGGWRVGIDQGEAHPRLATG